MVGQRFHDRAEVIFYAANGHGGWEAVIANLVAPGTPILVPGTGPHPGLPGNYLYGSVYETGGAAGAWAVSIHDSDTGSALCEAPALPAALEKLQEVLASAPFNMNELEALGFSLL